MRSLVLSVFILLAVGCQRARTGESATQPSADPTPPGSQDASPRIQPANVVAAPVERAPSVLLIDQKPVQFPPAVLQLRNRDGQLTAILMSDDPKEAIEDNYHGNSFYLEMPLEISDSKDLPSFVYRYIAPSSEHADSPNGIFLDGNRLQLQPQQIQVAFDGDEASLKAVLSGQFQRFDTRDDNVAPRTVQVISNLSLALRK